MNFTYFIKHKIISIYLAFKEISFSHLVAKTLLALLAPQYICSDMIVNIVNKHFTFIPGIFIRLLLSKQVP